MKLSLIVPCFNEAENVELFQDETMKAFQDCGYAFEIIYVDDGSTDATLHNLKKLHAAQKCPTKVISFARNFGKSFSFAKKVRRSKDSAMIQSPK